MRPGEKQPHVPVFVGSTFSDLQLWRRAARDALAQLEAVVRGMEYFGSKSGSPVDECLRVVASCEVYIGLFGMRYGSVPEGYDHSMTHLEYDEAQKKNLPSLIYILDEENQPILPKHVEMGQAAEKLRDLKSELKKRHVVSFFTTPEDLRGRILHDLPVLLKDMGTEVRGDVETIEANTDADILRQFKALPKMFSGRPVTIEFITEDSFRQAREEDCKALGLELGATVFDGVRSSGGDHIRVFGERDVALALCRLQKNVKVLARTVTAFGVYERIDWTEDGTTVTPEIETGFIVKEIVRTGPVREDK